MKNGRMSAIDRREFVGLGVTGLALASVPACFGLCPSRACAEGIDAKSGIETVVRPPTLFAGIRRPITAREQLEPRIGEVRRACGDRIAGPLTHIFRFDTPVEGFDSEIGFPVTEPVDSGDVRTHTLREMHFYSAMHHGPDDTVKETRGTLYEYMNTTGLSPELETVEVFHHRDAERPHEAKTQVMASFLAWPEVYRAQLGRVLGEAAAGEIWRGGEDIDPHTPVDPRCEWVAASIARLKQRSTVDEQFDILSRVALVRPGEDIARYKELYDRTGDLADVLRAQEADLEARSGKKYPDPWRWDGRVLHLSKVPYDHEAYAAATTHEEKRKAYCFCNLVREAAAPRVDPIFCYRAAGWSRQFFEPILGREFAHCVITHSILKGDDFCAWDYHLA